MNLLPNPYRRCRDGVCALLLNAIALGGLGGCSAPRLGDGRCYHHVIE